MWRGREEGKLGGERVGTFGGERQGGSLFLREFFLTVNFFRNPRLTVYA